MNSLMIFTTSILVLFLGYVIYGGIMSGQWRMNSRKKTPAREREADGAYGCATAPVAFGSQFAALGGLGMIQGIIVALDFGWMPALLLLLLGGVFLGGVQVYGGLLASMSQNGQSMGSMVQERLGFRSGKWFQLIGWLCTVAIVSVLLESAAGQAAGILPGEGQKVIQELQGGALSMMLLLLYPAAVFLGFLNRLRCPVVITTLLGIIFLGVIMGTGLFIPFYLEKEIWMGILMVSGVLAAVLPVWLLTQPKNYLGSLLTIFLLLAAALGIFVQKPEMSVPAFAGWYVDEQGLFPWLLVALGASVLSGYQSISVTVFGARQVNNERNAKAVGYGPVLLQCLLGVVALVVAGSFTVSETQKYESSLEIFAGSLLGLFDGAVFGVEISLLLKILIGLVLTVLMLTALESGIRVGSVTFRDLVTGNKHRNIFGQNSLLAAVITTAAAFGLRYVDMERLGRVLVIYLMLLAVPVCFTVMVWQKQSGKNSRLLFLPLAGAEGAVISIAGYFLAENLKIVIDKGASQETTWEFIEIFFLIVGLIVSMIFVMDGVRGYMKKRRIIFATGNAGKMREIHEILGDLDAEILSLKEAGIEEEIEENGSTFEENAIIKAKAICEMTGCLVLADDSGLEIDYLDKEPGVLSARYMGEDTPYTIKNNKLIERLSGVPLEERTARFVCVIAAAFPDGKVQTTRGAMEGYIGYEEKGENGFGYDPIFFLEEYGCSSAELSMEEKNKISHRGKALRAMKEKLV